MLYGISRPETVPSVPPLASFPTQIGSWRLLKEGYVDQETRDVLKADDLLSRIYGSPNERMPADVFIASFLSQRTGKAPHSPKNCLPGAGWLRESSGEIQVDVPNHAPIAINRYIISKGDQRSLVLYWYQSRNRVVASEYTAKVYVVLDSLRYNRTDTALVRVVTPVEAGKDEAAEKRAIGLVKELFPLLGPYFPL